MKTAAVRSFISLFITRLMRKTPNVGGRVRRAIAPALALILLAPLSCVAQNFGFAEQEEVQVSIVPRVPPVAIKAVQQASVQRDQADSTAQQSAQPAATPSSSPSQASDKLTLLPGTRLPLGLTRPLQIKSKQAQGSVVYMQVTFPVTAGGRMAVPPGAYVQGVIEKMTFHRGSNPDLQFEMRSADLIFPSGYTVAIPGAVHLEHRNAKLVPLPTPAEQEQIKDALLPNAMNRPPVAMSAAAVTPPTLPPLPSMNGARTAIIVVGSVSAAAVVGLSIYAVTRSSNEIYLETGTPLEIVLSAALVVDAQSACISGPFNAGAAQPAAGQPDTTQAPQQPATAPPPAQQPPIVQPHKKPQLCYTPGTPGTPDTVIPGTPGTPPVGDIPGTPGTPDIRVPGTPATQGYWHTCGK